MQRVTVTILLAIVLAPTVAIGQAAQPPAPLGQTSKAEAPVAPNKDQRARTLGPDGYPLYSNALAAVELRQALADLADASGATIICDETATGVVNVEFKEAEFTQALQLLLAPGGLVYEEVSKGVFVVLKPDPMASGFRQLAKTTVVPLRNIRALELQAMVPEGFKALLELDMTANRVVVLAPTQLSKSVVEWVREIDREARPVIAVPPMVTIIPLELRYLTGPELLSALPEHLKSAVTVGPDQDHVIVKVPAVDKEVDAFVSQVKAFDLGHEVLQLVQLQNITAKTLKDLLPPTLRSAVAGADDSRQVTLAVPPRRMQDALAQVRAIDVPLPAQQAPPADLTQLVPLAYVDGGALLKLLPKAYASRVQVEDTGRRAMVTAPADLLPSVVAAIGALDQPPLQVMIEALVVETSRDDLDQFEVSSQGKYWGGDSVQGAIMYGGPASTLLQKVLWLVERNRAKIKASPRVVAQDGKEASVRLSSNQYFSMVTGTLSNQYVTLEAIEAAIGLTMTPRVAQGDRMVTCTLQPEVGDVSGTGANALPIITKRTASTTVRVADGQPIAIGGLLQEAESVVRRKIPILGDLPLVGSLFRSSKTLRSQREITIFVVPHILDDHGSFVGPLLFERLSAPPPAASTMHATDRARTATKAQPEAGVGPRTPW